MRADIADVRLADQVFAPHYAAPMPLVLTAAAALVERPSADAEMLAQLAAGDVFEALDFAGGHAWGIAPGKGLVGYLPLSALGRGAA
ncbi:SH3 domain-containing protein [Sphingomonas aracearum]|uniref:SH3 domain-containing protein n=1 Tax=Sphingomonas aracearum TaxID=2283317 RepID=A0A369VUP5_9SPHN|nr:SH3 domain-containing protein [Sphingomonas aracearum]